MDEVGVRHVAFGADPTAHHDYFASGVALTRSHVDDEAKQPRPLLPLCIHTYVELRNTINFFM